MKNNDIVISQIINNLNNIDDDMTITFAIVNHIEYLTESLSKRELINENIIDNLMVFKDAYNFQLKKSDFIDFKVMTSRLIKSTRIDFNKGFYWGDINLIKLKDIENAIKKGMKEETEYFKGLYIDNYNKDFNYHIGRVIYFVNHPEEIKDLEVLYEDEGFKGMGANTQLVDGNHRLAAAQYLQLKEINIKYKGRQDILDYLTGKRKIQPSGFSWKLAEK